MTPALDRVVAEALAAAPDIDDADRRAMFVAEVVAVLVAAGDLGRAATVAEGIGETDRFVGLERALAFGDIAAAEERAGDAEAARRTLARAVAAARGAIVPERGEAEPALFDLVEALVEHGAAGLAEAAAEAIADAEERDRGRAEVAGDAARGGRMEEAERILGRIESARPRASALAAVAAARAADGRSAEALAMALEIAEAGGRAQALARIAAAAADAGETDAALATAARAFSEADAGAEPWERMEALAIGLRARVRAGDAAGAVREARAVGQDFVGGWALWSVAAAEAQAGAFTEAMDTARLIDEPFFRGQAVESIVRARARSGAFDEALAAARELDLPSVRARALAHVAESQAEADDRDGARRTIGEVVNGGVVGDILEDRLAQLKDMARAYALAWETAAVGPGARAAVDEAGAADAAEGRLEALLWAAWLLVHATAP